MTTKAPPLFAHQKVSKSFLKKTPISLDTSDPGTGKTRVHIETLVGRTLVFCPKSIMRSAWFDDIKKYAPDLKVSIAYATNREEAFNAEADVYVTNHDAVNWLAKQTPGWWKKMAFNTVIIDESGAYKHATSGRSRSAAKIMKHFKYRRALNGTPNSNGILDVWHQYFLLDGGARLGRSFYNFRSSVCTPEEKDQRVTWVEKVHAPSAVSGMVKDITLRHKFEDCVDIPPNHQYSMSFELNKKHKALYDEMENDAILQFKSGKKITAINGAVLYGKLLQIASGAVYGDKDEDGNGSYTLIDSDRYDLVSDLIEERQHSVCFFLWQHQRDELIKRMKARKISHAIIDGKVSIKNRERIVDEYQQGFYQVLLAHPKSAGHGLTLTRGTSTIWASPTSNLEWYEQGLRRIYRISQKEKTETIVIVAPGTREESVYESLIAKNLKMATLLNFLKKAA